MREFDNREKLFSSIVWYNSFDMQKGKKKKKKESGFPQEEVFNFPSYR